MNDNRSFAEKVGHFVGLLIVSLPIAALGGWIAMLTLGALALDHPRLGVPALSFWQATGVMWTLRAILTAAAGTTVQPKGRQP